MRTGIESPDLIAARLRSGTNALNSKTSRDSTVISDAPGVAISPLRRATETTTPSTGLVMVT